MRAGDVRRIRLGSFVRPAEPTGTGQPRVEAVYGYLVRHPQALLLLDTGIGIGDDQTEARYRPRRAPLSKALAAQGVSADDVDLVVNCHLHFDHCGGNALFGGTPVVCQRRELASAQAGGYTFPELLDYPGARYELLDGEAEPLPGVHVIPTPGHVDGHQSLVIRCADGTVILAGQSHDTASGWSSDALAVVARALGHDDPLPTAPAWMSRLLEFDPKRVMFAHDAAVWEPPG
jgi:N-acyl homoserine lactone hydrolase